MSSFISFDPGSLSLDVLIKYIQAPLLTKEPRIVLRADPTFHHDRLSGLQRLSNGVSVDCDYRDP